MVYVFGLFGLLFILILILELKEYKKASQTGKNRTATFWKGRLKTIFILGILFSIFIAIVHNPEDYRIRGYDAIAHADAKNAYTAAQAYFTDYPGSTISLSKLTSYGFVQSNYVNLIIISGKKHELEITSAHSEGAKTYTINSDGEISF